MSSVTVNLSDTFEQWRVKTNSISSQSGDLGSLSTTAKGSLVDAINEVASSDSDDMENLIDDTSPQLGANLDLNNFNIINSGGGQSTITVTGTITAAEFVGAVQLSGNLDLNNYNITGTGSIAGTITGVTQSPSDNSTKLATTAYVDAQPSITTLLALSDTNITTPINGQQLVYNSNTTKWENATASGGGGVNSSGVAYEKQTLIANSSDVSFTLNKNATAVNLLVSVGGVIQEPDIAYTVSGNTLTFSSAPSTGSVVYVIFLSTTPGATEEFAVAVAIALG